MVQHKQLLKQLNEQDNKAVINSTDSYILLHVSVIESNHKTEKH